MPINFAQLGTRFIAVLTLILVGLLGIATAVWLELNVVAAEANDIGERRVPQVVLMTDLRTHVARIQAQTRKSLLDSSPEQRASTQADINATFKSIEDGLEDFAQHIFSDKARQQVAALRTHLATYRAATVQLEKELAGGNREAAMAQLDVASAAREPLLKVLLEAREWQQKILTDRTLEMEKDAAKLQTHIAVMVAVLLVLAVVASAWLVGQLRRRIQEAVDVAHRIAANDLAEPVAVTGNDEFTALLHEMAAMRDALHSVVSAARQASDSIQVAATEVASGNQDLAGRTEQAASNLEETASSMEEITATVRQSADAAAQANQLASTATAVAQRGGKVVGEVVATMADINQSSQKIADIIGVIDSIAFQTNILALNAAVEAARAGEAGRGFAVVASEVRSLAGRSAQAAKEIKDLISASVEKVQSGTTQVQDAGATMSEIVASVQRVTDVMGEITAAAAEQSNGIAQVNVAVNQLDQMTQQNAALVEQSTAAAESLRDQAHKLAEVVSVFKLGAGTTTSRPSPRPPARTPTPQARVASPSLHKATKSIANKPTPSSAKPIKGSNSLPHTPAPPRSRLAASPPATAPGTSGGKPADDGSWESF